MRLANETDLQYLADVEKSAARKFVEFYNNDTSFLNYTLAHDILVQAQQNKTLWLGTDDQNITGFLAATYVDNMLYIEELSVCYDYQGRGIGRNLLNHAIDQARLQKTKGLSLTTNKEVPWTKPFYEKMGFKEISTKECSEGLRSILIRNKENSKNPDNRVAMVLKFDR